MARTQTFSVRATPDEIARWREAAGETRFNDWVKMALRDQASLDEATARERKSSQRDRQQTLTVTFPQGSSCPKDGGYCYTHDTRHV